MSVIRFALFFKKSGFKNNEQLREGITKTKQKCAGTIKIGWNLKARNRECKLKLEVQNNLKYIDERCRDYLMVIHLKASKLAVTYVNQNTLERQ